MQEILQEARTATGPAYLELELRARQQVEGDRAALAALERRLADDDVVVALMSHVLLEWSGERRRDYEAALAYLDRVPASAARTAMGTPSPTGSESYLTLHFADRLTKLLGLRLLKEGGWPRWKAAAAMLYLEKHRDFAVTGALLRYAIETPDDTRRGYALETLAAVGDPRLAAKQASEIARARRLGRPVPAAVVAFRP